MATNPYVQFDLGAVMSTLDAVTMVVRTDCCLERSTNLNLYLTNTTSIQVAAPFATGVSATVLGQTLTVAVPDGLAGQYLTILRNGSDTAINLHEVTILASSEYKLKPSWCACVLLLLGSSGASLLSCTTYIILM
jgi:hypothetical protein